MPEVHANPAPKRILDWKRRGKISTPIAFATYKGIHYWTKRDETHVAAVVVHCRSERRNKDASNLHFIPLHLNTHPGLPAQDYVFVGGRKERDFDMAFKALSMAGVKAKIVSDRIPKGMKSKGNVEVIGPHKIPSSEYIDLLQRCRYSIVPVKPGDFSHGHSDVVRSLLASKPVIATRGGSCDDYIDDGVNGLLANADAVDLCRKILDMENNLDLLTSGARVSAHQFEWPAYEASLIQLASDIVASRPIGNN